MAGFVASIHCEDRIPVIDDPLAKQPEAA